MTYDFGLYMGVWAKRNNKAWAQILSLLYDNEDNLILSTQLEKYKDIEELWKARSNGARSLYDILEKKLLSGQILFINWLLQRAIGYSPFDDVLFAILDLSKNMYAIANYREKYIARAIVNENDQTVRVKEIVIKAVPIKWDIIYDPLGSPRRFRVIFDIGGGRKLQLEGEAPEIAQRLEIEGFVLHKRLAQDVITAILNINDPNRVKTTENTIAPGVYYMNGEITLLNKEWQKEWTKEELREALLLLNRIAEFYDKKKFATIIKWGLAAPFGYVYKQFGKWIRWLYLYGRAKAGKSTLGEIILHIYGEDTYQEKTGTSIDTEYRLGEVLRTQTFPVLVNEAEGFFGKKRGDLIDMLNNAIQKRISRGKYYRGSYVEFPALATMIFTSNHYLPHNPATQRRFIKIGFTEKDKVQPDKEKEFAKLRLEFDKLEAIGYHAIKEGLDLFNDSVFRNAILDMQIPEIKLGESILAILYTKANLEVPEWVKEEEEEEEIEEDLEGLIRDFFLETINEAYRQYLGKIETYINTAEDDVIVSVLDNIENRTRKVLEADLIPGIKLKGEEVLIQKTIVNKLEEKIVGLGGLRGLADTLGWSYSKKSYRDGEKIRNKYVVSVPLRKFIEFLEED